GADIGGSIRFPSHFNGIVGFKSGNRQVSQEGNFPYIDKPEQERMLGIGAMSKSVQDARLINEIIAHEPPSARNLDDFKLVYPVPH
ncbi:amidase family protein, partial [Micrococcus sp. SIMBA_144]